MADDATQRRKMAEESERRRQAETGAERGREELLRGREELLRGREEILRGREEILRGREEILRGGEAVDIFRRAADLGGHLIVAFVAPVAAPGQSSTSGVRSSPSAADQVAAAAQADLDKKAQKLKEASMGPPSEPSASETSPTWADSAGPKSVYEA